MDQLIIQAIATYSVILVLGTATAELAFSIIKQHKKGSKH
jgi:hypothetical protein